MTPEQASALRIAIHRLVRAEREYAILGCGSRVVCRKHQAAIAVLLREATVTPVPQVGNAYVQERNSGWGPVTNRCLGCNQTYRSEHAAKFHPCPATTKEKTA